MNNPELCKWLRDNSSGVYRPAAEAATQIEVLTELLADLIKAERNNTGFEPSLSVYRREVSYAQDYLAEQGMIAHAKSDHFEPELSDVKAYLAAIGMIAVPVEPTEGMIMRGGMAILECACSDMETNMAMFALYDAGSAYKAMIKAAGERA